MPVDTEAVETAIIAVRMGEVAEDERLGEKESVGDREEDEGGEGRMELARVALRLIEAQ
jgi:hypothetical protein